MLGKNGRENVEGRKEGKGKVEKWEGGEGKKVRVNFIHPSKKDKKNSIK